ncbi:transposase IS3/IS911 family protein [Acidimicrobium ferrooxidans DSM 10331]|uniref:Transposase IS3/IS911 family protein n=1 Tax=Acidimicrobium ferrooxidans (strain DSM 10331 / JCM 15462 / NBRC 103882 / ICP) TaxID=525909 RepID=C7LY09_ACIFD|nr:transposase [Acidimicrobium ferrooxidans]ACU53038.1 transposase IS3/IS911 family protein [Acidimicrobium ferrooxidans DSM 10331]ACU53247.1 transposase IS3/IS911 family protein [Acidimicrobium ferrooxidans DSM 10331]ACU53414.1 transposase IS3/IS911 family protein [Acidimicrobium ferrooxidans DSM 10331]ACU53476.1 transposase IS3/IS911 family protein [Acidimicrobium ferrooxidans DSM 10331]ACU53617.1 transposase IS3/IS911 family protein [Acidimicrobium ferrooxidans DSM 10331]
MGTSRRKFTLEYRTEAAHRVIDSGRSVPEVARELAIGEHNLYRWVREERRRIEAANATGSPPLTAQERTELIRLRRELEELRKDNEFLGKAAAYFAAKPPSKRDSR